MKNRIIITTISIIFTIAIVYIGVKGTILILYKESMQKINNSIIEAYNYPINIKTNNYLTGNNITFDKLSYRNVYDNFTKCSSESNYEMYCLNYNDINFTSDASIVIGKYTNYIDNYYVKNNAINKNHFKLTSEIINNGIKTPADLIDFAVFNYNYNINIFSNIEIIKKTYFAKSILKQIEDYSFIDGSLQGVFYQKNKNVYNIELFYDKDLYYIYFANSDGNNFFTKEHILNFLEYVKFIEINVN